MFDGGISLLDMKFLNEFTKKSPFKTVHLDANQRAAVGWWNWIFMVFSRPRDVPEYFSAFLTADEIALESCRQVTWQLWVTQVLFTIVGKSLKYLSCERYSDVHSVLCIYAMVQSQY